MPIHRTTKNGRPALQYGTTGAKYTYTPGNVASAAPGVFRRVTVSIIRP